MLFLVNFCLKYGVEEEILPYKTTHVIPGPSICVSKSVLTVEQNGWNIILINIHHQTKLYFPKTQIFITEINYLDKNIN